MTLGSFATDIEKKKETKRNIPLKKFSNFADKKYKPFKESTENTTTFPYVVLFQFLQL